MTHEHVGRVAVGVDGGPGSAGALRYAVEEARRTGAELHLIHVSPSYPPVGPMTPALPAEIARAGDEILQQARHQVRQLAPDLRVATSRHPGSRVAELVAGAEGARLLVVGRETRGSLERLLAGGTTASVAAHASVPVVAVPAGWASASVSGPIVVGLKTQAHAEELLGAAFHRATATGAPIHVVHAWRLPDEYVDRIEARAHGEYWLTRGSELVEKELEPWRRDYPDVSVTVGVVHAEPAHALVEAAHGARLLMLVRRLPGRVLGAHLGGTARAVLRTVTCPVEIVPATRLLTDAPGLELEESGAMLR